MIKRQDCKGFEGEGYLIFPGLLLHAHILSRI